MGLFFALVMKKLLIILNLSLILSVKLLADLVITTDGARLTGTIITIDEGSLILETDYAGTLTIAQDKVASIETDEPIFVRLQSGATLKGAVQRSSDNQLRLISTDGTLETDMQRIQNSWRPDATDPEVVRHEAEVKRLSRRWLYEATFDMLGRSGNTSEFGLGSNFSANLKGPDDSLRFYGTYEYRERNGTRTADRVIGGGEYENFPTKFYGWYLRSQLDTDRIRQVDLRSNSAGGASFRLINKEKHSLTARTGIGYEYTSFTTNTPDSSEGVVDLGLNHRKQLNGIFLLRNRLVFTSAFDDFGDYRAVHESSLEFPIGSSRFWSVRTGITNEYESKPEAAKRLDTIYFTRMVLSWD
jgi:hypothetical protein